MNNMSSTGTRADNAMAPAAEGCDKSPRPMTCKICGDYAGRFQQHPYMPRGQSLCPPCAHVVSGITSAVVMQKQYGKAGVNYPRVGGV